MKIFILIIVSVFLVAPSLLHAQEPVKLDEFGRLYSKELEGRLDDTLTELSKHPDARIQFMISRGENDSLGSSYQYAAKFRAFVENRKKDTKHFVLTICEAKPKLNIQVWLLTSAAMKECKPDSVNIQKTIKFDTAVYEKSPFKTCCVVDGFGPIQADASLKAFADLLKEYPDTTAYLFVYGGTQFYWIKDSFYSDRRLTGLDKKRETHDFVRKAKKFLTTAGIDSSRVKIKIAGYRDPISTVQMWIVPEGGEIPKPKAK